MALKTDDCDIRDVHFYMDSGGNGDFYINLVEYPKPDSVMGSDELCVINYRMAMSGGFASKFPEVKAAFVQLYRAMESAGLNNHPIDDSVQALKSKYKVIDTDKRV